MVRYRMSFKKMFLLRSAALSLSLLFCPLGCAQSVSAPSRVTKPASVKKTQKNKPAAPVNLGAVVQGVEVNLLDPKQPTRLLCHIKAATATGFLGSMTGVSALLYDKGKPAATLASPLARGSSLRGSVIVTATGGVYVKSLLHPGTTLRADQVVWKPRVNQIVATGHVVFTDGKTHATIKGPQATADTAMQSLTMGSSHVSAVL